jgi:hypothetical protein
MTTIGVAIVALLVVAVLARGRALRLGSLVIGILVGLLVGATPVGPAMASGIAAGGNWVWSKVSTL